MTSQRTGSPHFILSGCRHSDAIGRSAITPAIERENIEERWNAEAKKLLAERTATWSPLARDEFCRVLGYTPPPPTDLILEPPPEPPKP